MADSAKVPEGDGGRPWPAPSADAGWWHSDAVDPSSSPGDHGSGAEVTDIPPGDHETVAAVAAATNIATEETTPPVGPYTKPPARRSSWEPTGTRRFDDPAAGRVTAGALTLRPKRPPRRSSTSIVAAPPAAAPPAAAPPAAAPPAARPAPSAGPDAGLYAGGGGWGATRIAGVAPGRTGRAGPRSVRGRRRGRSQPPPWVALPALLLLAAVATFVSWVSAEPFWLAVGHGRSGTATIVTSDDGCRAEFMAGGGAFATQVDLAGLPPPGCRVGTAVPVRMVSRRSQRAYALTTGGLHLRWAVGFVLVLTTGLATAWVIGARRLRGWRRATAVVLSLAAPLGMMIAMLAAAY